MSRLSPKNRTGLRRRISGGEGQHPDRLKMLSDGVFSIALTLLIIDVVALGVHVNPGETLAHHLLHQWPTLVAYITGFMTIFVCWINNHRVFHYVNKIDSGLIWINGLQLALVAAVPLPTAVLAAHLTGGEGQRTAFILYGITYVLMAISFWSLSYYVDRRGLTDPSIDPDRYHGMLLIYRFSFVWTTLSLAVATVSVYSAIVMWTFMFAVFAFPAEFSHFMHLWSQWRAKVLDD